MVSEKIAGLFHGVYGKAREGTQENHDPLSQNEGLWASLQRQATIRHIHLSPSTFSARPTVPDLDKRVEAFQAPIWSLRDLQHKLACPWVQVSKSSPNARGVLRKFKAGSQKLVLNMSNSMWKKKGPPFMAVAAITRVRAFPGRCQMLLKSQEFAQRAPKNAENQTGEVRNCLCSCDNPKPEL